MPKLISIALLALVASTAQAFTLAEGGRPRAAIVLPREPIAAEETAAAELATYLEKVSGAQFATVREGAEVAAPRILVGPSEAAEHLLGEEAVAALGPEEYIVRTVGDDLLLVGGRPRGTLYAVLSFLEDDLGCLWFTWYGDESIPTRETLEVGALDRRGAPALQVRDMTTHTSHNSDRVLLQQFLVRNRMQGPDLRFTGDLTAYGGSSHAFAFPPEGWLVHTLFQWVPPDEHFETHPEWFSLAGDQRVRGRQLCFSNPQLRGFLTETILARIGEENPAGTYSVSAMDWEGAFCDCPACRALVEREGTPGAPLFDYLAELGPIVKSRYPQAFISTLAYRKGQSEAPPKTIKLPDNVVIIFAPIDDNFAAPIAHESNRDTAANLTAWPQAARHVWVWYYPNTYGPALPMGNLGRMAEDFRLFSRVGVEGCYIEHDAPGIYDSRRLADLQTWLLTKLAWDPDRDIAGLIETFTDRHYGPAAPFIRAYVAALEQATRAMESAMAWNAPTAQHRFLTPGLLVDCQAIFDDAVAAVAQSPELLARVRQARMSLDLACIMLWERLTAEGEVPFTKAQVVARYRETYAKTVEARSLPGRRQAMLKAMEDSIRWHAVRTDPRPLPAPLADTDPRRVRQLTPETARLHGGGAELVEDPAAAVGFAVRMEAGPDKPGYAPADLPAKAFNFGFYDSITKRQQHGHVPRPEATADYHLYSIGRTKLNSACLVWFDWSWRVQFPEVTGLYSFAEPDRQWDIYVSLRFEGPAYGGEAPDGKNRFYVDRVVLVEVD